MNSPPQLPRATVRLPWDHASCKAASCQSYLKFRNLLSGYSMRLLYRFSAHGKVFESTVPSIRDRELL